ncbi:MULTISPECIES: DMT family transporter [Dehalococcoides]|nr:MULTISPECIES: DMT family transporter [Dehalococcoides]AGG05807.1 putative membrane protein [Dehalococcoides mccartyi DCMB5]MBA2084578.1 putative membrane protein [Dehalococcoides mccartyi]PKH45393.1 EamA family transporter [Dehalococcoides mccartyi]QBX63302.1 DMT family transporter [Dehalococcoides mccartyi]BAS31292.1 hypothetical protein IBK_0217 [Dehalococcoides mccartyi IBARAKI]
MLHMKAKTYLLLLLGVFGIAAASVFTRLADAPPVIIASLRMLAATLLLLPFAARPVYLAIKCLSRRNLLLIILAGFLVGMDQFFWVSSLEYTSIASSVILVTSHPVLVAIMSYIMWREQLNPKAIFGVLAAFGGMVLINLATTQVGEQAFLGNMLAMAATIPTTGYLIIGRQMRNSIDFLPYITLLYGSAAFFLLAGAFISGDSFGGYPGTTYLMIFLLAVVSQLVGHSSLNMALRLVPALVVSVAILGEPVGAIILGYLFLGEGLTFNEFLGGMLVLAGILIVMLNQPRTKKMEAEIPR